MSFETVKKAGLLACALAVAGASSAAAEVVTPDLPSTTISEAPTSPAATGPSNPETQPEEPPTESVPTTTTTTPDATAPLPSAVDTTSSSGSGTSSLSPKTETTTQTPASGLTNDSSYSVSAIKVKLLANGSLNVSIRCITSKLTVCTGKVRVSAPIGTIGRGTFKVVSGRDVWINVDLSNAGMEYLRQQSSPKVRVNLVSTVNASAASVGKSFKVHPKKKRSKSTKVSVRR